MASDGHRVAIPADPNDPDDFDVSVAGLERAHMGRWIRRLRNRLGMSQDAFSAAYRIPLADLHDYEIGRAMPPEAVRAYLKVIGEEPEVTARALGKAA